MTDKIAEIQAKITRARDRMRSVQAGRARLAGILGGLPGMVQTTVEFPDPDIAHVYQCLPSGRKMGDPVIYRLSFGCMLTWVVVSHPWGLKPADIVVDSW